ncbi:MAG: 3-phosphoshikimate 1-carboxyvinyltransferase [Candidatus Gastranaerophilaceae bacterium]|jgi:3-phosphoshikimate 1-carboxyvinyltransferase
MKNINLKVQKIKTGLKGSITIPSDKSVSHRAAMFSSLTRGNVEISNFSKGADCHSTLEVLTQLGVEVKFKSETNLIINNKNGFSTPSEILNAGNSGTTIRLMSGMLVGQNFICSITGDESLKTRPMGRIIEPLRLMGANITPDNNDNKAPLTIIGSKLTGINYNSPISSAQVKSCLILAGLHSEGNTIITEPYLSRDHTEKMLKYMGAAINVHENTVSITKSELKSVPISIPGDISSAAFFLVAGSIVPNSEIIIKNVGLNPTRTGIIDVLTSMGSNIEILNYRTECGEEVGDIRVSYSKLKGTIIEGSIIPRLIDELPVIAVAATQAEGQTIIKDAQDLKNKESDRIKTVCLELEKLGANIEETPDGFIIEGKTPLKGGCELECYHDHRLAMSWYVAGLIANSEIIINEFNWVNISFPEFESLMNSCF